MTFPLYLYRVAGHSMVPTYVPSDLLLGWRWFKPKIGQVVVARTPELLIIKRIKRIDDGGVWLEGDNLTASNDSRHFGSVPLEQIQARIIAKLT